MSDSLHFLHHLTHLCTFTTLQDPHATLPPSMRRFQKTRHGLILAKKNLVMILTSHIPSFLFSIKKELDNPNAYPLHLRLPLPQ